MSLTNETHDKALRLRECANCGTLAPGRYCSPRCARREDEGQ